MVILITGASHTGKTLLAQRLLERLRYPCLSIDHLKMGLIRSGNTNLTPEDDDALTEYLWPIVREMVKTAIENRQNLIVEGCYIPFGWRHDFDENYLRSIQFVCLAMSDTYIENHFEEIKAHASDIEARLDDTSCTVERLKADNRAFAEGFQKSGEPIVWIDQDFKSTVNGLLSQRKGSQWTSRFLAVVKSILMVAGVLFFLVFASVLLDTPGARRFSRYRSHPDLKTLLAVEKDDITAKFNHERGGTNFTFVVLKPCRFLSSGPAVLVYDFEGNLFDKSLDEGDDSRFQRKWGEWRRSWPDYP